MKTILYAHPSNEWAILMSPKELSEFPAKIGRLVFLGSPQSVVRRLVEKTDPHRLARRLGVLNTTLGRFRTGTRDVPPTLLPALVTLYFEE